MNLKKWEVAPLNRERAAQIAERYSLPFFLSMMLEIRGFSSEEQIRGLLSGGQRQALTLLMATLNRPQLLLLDEHTAALDPKTADKVLHLTEEIVARDHLTTLMVTHNMRNAIQYGNRLIMMDAGRIVVDVRGEEKKNLSVRDLLEKFNVENDRMLLSE